jgi:hypothetical protein
VDGPKAVRNLFVVALLVVAILAVSPPCLAGQARPRADENEVKAAFLYQFGRYVEWPAAQERSGSMFLICVLGEDPFGPALDEIVKGKSISGGPVAIKRIIGPGELRDCRILFVSRSEDDRLPAILKTLEGRMVLTVGEGAQFTRRGGMVAFTSQDSKVRFAINLAAAEGAKLRLSSQLLRIAARVEQ